MTAADPRVTRARAALSELKGDGEWRLDENDDDTLTLWLEWSGTDNEDALATFALWARDEAEFILAAPDLVRDLLAAYADLRDDAAGVLLPDLLEIGNRHAAELAGYDQLRAAEARVREIHAPIDAVHELTGEHHKLCAGCSTARDQWVKWPCRTINALDTRKVDQ